MYQFALTARKIGYIVRGTTEEQPMAKFYTASKSRNQGREGWSVIFRHPVRLDPVTGKAGRRIRRGLSTADEGEADRMVEELNQLLKSPALWETGGRALAVDRFDRRVIDIFYEGTEAASIDFAAIRENFLPLPGKKDGYRKVMLLGTTGAGKTTVVRQLLGTDPEAERFPSTSTAKTTTADTELVLTSEGPYRAVVTFAARDEVADFLAENVSTAGLAIYRNRPDREVLRLILDHVNQRFRFSYVLGRSVLDDGADDTDNDDDSEANGAIDSLDPAAFGSIDLDATALILRDCVAKLRKVVGDHATRVREQLQPADDDERVLAELIEDDLETELRQTEEFHQIVDVLLEEIEKRFSLLDADALDRNRQGWPVSWTWESAERTHFLKTIAPFSSNFAPLFGRLLTPLVNGVRVSGPFRPIWAEEAPRLVLIDGEGLGHTPNSAATLSTSVARQLEQVDAVLLVDNATQPMQAAPVAALKALAVSGNGIKLSVLFTHFDQVGGPNLPTFSAREEHVLASAESVLKAIGDELGPPAERILRQRIDQSRFFVGGIQQRLDSKSKAANRSIQQLAGLVDSLQKDSARDGMGVVRPVFDRMNLSLAVAEATKAFHARWRGLLGLEFNPAAPKEHWSRVKALSRRMAEGWHDEYDTLRPVADLRTELQKQIYLMLQRPVRWEGGVPTDEQRQVAIDGISNAITQKLFDLTETRIREDARLAWQQAYAQRGSGSTFGRAKMIAAEVYDRRAPIPGVAASPDQNMFLRAVADLVGQVAQELELELE